MRRPIARDQNQRKRAVGSQVSSWVNFNPLSLRPLLWLDAADTATITTSGSSVTQWDDKSGNAINVSQGTAARQPQSGTTLMNGLNTLSFDGGDHLRSADGAITAPSLSGFAVIFGSSFITVNCVMGIPHLSTTHSGPFFRWVLNRVSDPSGNLDLRIDTQTERGGVVNTNIPYIVWAQSSDGDGYINLLRAFNGLPRTVTYPNSVPFLVGANAANGEGWNGQISEIVLFDREVTWQEASSLVLYLSKKWNVLL